MLCTHPCSIVAILWLSLWPSLWFLAALDRCLYLSWNRIRRFGRKDRNKQNTERLIGRFTLTGFVSKATKRAVRRGLHRHGCRTKETNKHRLSKKQVRHEWRRAGNPNWHKKYYIGSAICLNDRSFVKTRQTHLSLLISDANMPAKWHVRCEDCEM